MPCLGSIKNFLVNFQFLLSQLRDSHGRSFLSFELLQSLGTKRECGGFGEQFSLRRRVGDQLHHALTHDLLVAVLVENEFDEGVLSPGSVEVIHEEGREAKEDSEEPERGLDQVTHDAQDDELTGTALTAEGVVGVVLAQTVEHGHCVHVHAGVAEDLRTVAVSGAGDRRIAQMQILLGVQVNGEEMSVTGLVQLEVDVRVDVDEVADAGCHEKDEEPGPI